MNEQGTNGQGTNGRAGYSGKSLFFMFLGGALTGAAAAYLAQGQNRARVREIARSVGEKVGQLPQAVREASHAAKDAFAEAYTSDNEAVAAITHKKKA